MGCSSDCSEGDYPLHEVTLSAFEIDVTEVTQSAYQACMDSGICTPPACNFDPTTTPMHPVVCVSWVQAKAYCSFAGLRLPSEAEWEKAARSADQRKFPWGDTAPSCTLVNFSDCATGAEPVAGHPDGASPYGALDMSGNVWEWVNDYYAFDYYTTGPASDPPGPASGASRSFRGGAFGSPTEDISAWEREDWPESSQEEVLGFRCAM
jgi:formylglycine-generating enzyme required for sulfatase activity